MQWQRNKTWCIMSCALWLTACGSADQTASSVDPAVSSKTTTLSGSVGAGSATTKSVSSSGTCEADSVVATDTNGQATQAAVQNNCGFTLTIQPTQSYVITLLLNGQFVATLQFDSGVAGFPTTLLTVRDGTTTIALGRIHINGSTGKSTTEPLSAGASEDEGEELANGESPECHGGNTKAADCATANTEAHVLAVRPRPEAFCKFLEQAGVEVRFCDRVPLKAPVTAWVNCRVDSDSINSTTFHVEANGKPISCDYRLVRWLRAPRAKHHLVRCWHRADPFTADTIYTATLDGLRCQDGRTVAKRTWSWLTIDAARKDVDSDDDIENRADFTTDDGPTSNGSDPSTPTSGTTITTTTSTTIQ